MTEPDWTVTEPGVVDGMPPDCYHGDPVPGGSLSSGGAKRLLPPSCPAKFRWWADNGQEPAAHFDLGHAAHKLVLGVGPELVVVDCDDWRTKAAKAECAEARERGAVPLKAEQWQQVQDMAAAIRAHPVAGPLFEPGTGLPEQSLFWQDAEFGIWCRARPDWLPHWLGVGGRFLLADYKTCASANPADLEKAVVNYGYGEQAPWYIDGVEAVGLAKPGTVQWLWVFQEKTPPYVVQPMSPSEAVLERGRARNRLAMSTYVHCMETGVWPGYLPGVGLVSLPRWVEREFDDDLEHGYYDVKGRT
jgi:hypothetical protein